MLGSGTLPLSFSTVQINSYDCQVSQGLVKMSDKRVKTRATKRISSEKTPCVACPPSKTKIARKQLKMTTITPNSGGDTTIEAAPLVVTSILDAITASHGFGDVTVIPSTSASDFVVPTDSYAPVSSVTTTRGVDTFDAFEAVAAATMQPIDPYKRYKSFERREKRRRSRSVQNTDVTTFPDSAGADASLQTSHDVVMLEHARPRATSTVVRPASVQLAYDYRRHVYN